MALRLPLVLGANGLPQQLQPGDSTPGGSIWTAYVAALGDGIGVTEFEATVTDAAVTGTSVIEIRLASTDDNQENEPEFTNLWAMTAHPAAGNFVLTLSFAERHSGPLNLQYRIN